MTSSESWVIFDFFYFLLLKELELEFFGPINSRWVIKVVDFFHEWDLPVSRFCFFKMAHFSREWSYFKVRYGILYTPIWASYPGTDCTAKLLCWILSGNAVLQRSFWMVCSNCKQWSVNSHFRLTHWNEWVSSSTLPIILSPDWKIVPSFVTIRNTSSLVILENFFKTKLLVSAMGNSVGHSLVDACFVDFHLS